MIVAPDRRCVMGVSSKVTMYSLFSLKNSHLNQKRGSGLVQHNMRLENNWLGSGCE
jgi:hypothetical protein